MIWNVISDPIPPTHSLPHSLIASLTHLLQARHQEHIQGLPPSSSPHSPHCPEERPSHLPLWGIQAGDEQGKQDLCGVMCRESTRNRHADRVSRQAGTQVGRQAGRQVGRQAGRQAGVVMPHLSSSVLLCLRRATSPSLLPT